MVFKVFSATSKSIVFQWDKVPGATSYEINASNKNTPDLHISFATFGANTVMGSINTGLTPNTNYVFNIEAKDVSGRLNTGSVEHTTGTFYSHHVINFPLLFTYYCIYSVCTQITL